MPWKTPVLCRDLKPVPINIERGRIENSDWSSKKGGEDGIGREILDTLAVGAAGLRISSTAKSYQPILGSNDRLILCGIGIHSRAYAHLSGLRANEDAARIAYVCDVDSNTMKKFADDTQRELGDVPTRRPGLSPHPSEKEKSMPSRSQLRTTGMLLWLFSPCRRASMCIWKSRAATIQLRAPCSCKLNKSTASLCRWARSNAHLLTPSRLSIRFTMA